ncbi:GAF domain-containing protein [Rhodoferax ferrireducens]|nr:GAF domain-containing protein [Rhodoferax ferrireducens]
MAVHRFLSQGNLLLSIVFAVLIIFLALPHSFAESANQNKLVFLGNKNIAPVVYQNNMVPAGVVVDIVRALEKYMPQPIEIKTMDWLEAQALVAQGKADALIQINPTQERREIYDFSDTLLESQFSIFTTTNRVGISGMSSLRGLRVGVEAGGLPQQLLGKDPQILLTIIPNFIEGFKQLNAATVDAVVVDYRVGSYIIAENKIQNIRVTGEPVAFSYSSIAVKKGNEKLLSAINNGLKSIKADGSYQTVINNWKPKEVVFQTREQITQRIYYVSVITLFILFLIAATWTMTLKKQLLRRKAAEERLGEQYSTLSSIINSANALIFSLDRQYRYTSFNQGHADVMKALYGAQIEQGHSLLDYMTVPQDRETAQHNIDRAIAGEQVVEESYSGDELRSRQYFQVSHSPIKSGEDVIGVAVLAQDMSARKRSQLAQELNSQRMQMLLQLNQMAGATLKEIEDFTLEEAVRLTQSKIGYLAFVNEDESVLTMPAWSKLAMAEGVITEEPIVYPVETTGLWGEAVRQRRPVITNDYNAANPLKNDWPRGYVNLKRHMNVPVFDGARIVIVAGVGNKVEAYDEGDVQQLTLIMEGMWRLLEGKRSQETLHRLNRELRAISSCNQALLRTQDEQTLLNDICHIVCDEAGYRMAWVGYAEHDAGKTVRPAAWGGFDSGYIADAKLSWAEDTPRGQGPAGVAIRSAEIVYFQDLANDPSMAPWRESALQHGYRSGIALPLKNEGAEVFGVLLIYSAEINAFSPAEIRLLQELSGDLAFGITVLRARLERTRAEEALKNMAMKFRTIYESTSDAIMLIDEQGIFDCNAATLRIFACQARDDLVGKQPSQLSPPTQPGGEESMQLANEYIATAYRNGSHQFEWTHRRLDGAQFPADVLLTAMELGGKPVLQATVRDITRRKQDELALARANRALRTLSACNEALVRATNESGLLDAICRLIVETGGYRMAWVGFPEQNAAKTVRPAAHYGYDEGFLAEAPISWADIEPGRGPTGTAIRTGTVQVNQNFLLNPASAPWGDEAQSRGYQSNIALPLTSEAGTLGVLTIFAAAPDAFNETEVILLKELASDLAFGIATLRTRAERDRIAYEHQHHEDILRQSLEDSIKAIADTVEMRDPYTAGHQRRVGQLAVAIARELGLPEDTMRGIELAASIHDLGKISIPAEILAKPIKLTAIEYMLLKNHPQAGFDILKDIRFPWPIATMVLQHHERLDGSGYPQGLQGEQILLESRIMAVADVVEAMASHRPYRAALGVDAALAEIGRGRGVIYDTLAVDACLRLFAEKRFSFSS